MKPPLPRSVSTMSLYGESFAVEIPHWLASAKYSASVSDPDGDLLPEDELEAFLTDVTAADATVFTVDTININERNECPLGSQYFMGFPAQ
ncbi:MAG: hypothetical protein FWG42_08330 [Clostridiales bacterium]|nr:hypothetical protein [Clostridiales bacterium]